MVATAIVRLMLSRGAVHDRQIRSAFVQFCLRHGSGSGSGMCATIGMPHKSATCAGRTRTLEPHIMPTTNVTSTFRRNSGLNIEVPLFDYLSAPKCTFPARRCGIQYLGNGFRTVASGAKSGFVESRINSSQRALRYFKAKRPPESGHGVEISIIPQRSVPMD